MNKLDKLIELTTMEKLNRRNILEYKLRQQEDYGDIEELFDLLASTLNIIAKQDRPIAKHGRPIMKQCKLIKGKL